MTTTPRDPEAWADWLRAVPLLDGHNDLPIAHRGLAAYDLDAKPLDVPRPELQTDLPRLHAGGVGAQFWSVFVSPGLEPGEAVRQTLEQIDFVYAIAARYPDRLRVATTADEVRAAVDAGRIASLIGAEGGHQLGGSLGVLRMLHRLGMRYVTLTHTSSLDWADSATDEPRCGGLSAFGREVVAEMNRLGVLVDLSHVAVTTMNAALDCSTAPVIFSHSSARAITDHVRNVPDDVLTRLATNGGVCQVTFVAEFINAGVDAWRQEADAAAAEQGIAKYGDWERHFAFARKWARTHPAPHATVDDVVAHIEHVREVAGVEHVGIGGDFDGSDLFPDGLTDVGGYPALFAALAGRGWSDADLRKLAGENVFRVLADTTP